ncbi:DUF6417 family protein [Streptomyces sp. NPDC048448]|uniref:DUF6417 family protein n=1 Tax=Streptomyces sp. NPDC048448 TaxID=3365554 RepID=UPI003710691D
MGVSRPLPTEYPERGELFLGEFAPPRFRCSIPTLRAEPWSAHAGGWLAAAARLTSHGHDTLAYGRIRPRADPVSAETGGGQVVELLPSQMAALRVSTGLAGQLRVPAAEGLAEQVRAASCDHEVNRWRLYLTPGQIASVAYGFWLHRMTGSAAEAKRFAREYGALYNPS